MLPPGVDLEDGVDEAEVASIALWRNPSLRAELTRIDAARATLDEASRPANPQLSVMGPLSRDPLLSGVALVVRAPGNGILRLLSVAEGQSVPSGAPLLEIVAVDALQVRVPVYGGDLGRLDTHAAARVRRSGEDRAVEAPFAVGPPTAEPDRGTVDRYLALPAGAGFAPGERVLVELPLHDVGAALSIPSSAIVLDAWGGAWVYRCEDGRYVRARVDPVRRAGARTVLAHGPPAGSCVVSVGAAEIFGAEFPPGH